MERPINVDSVQSSKLEGFNFWKETLREARLVKHKNTHIG